ncbi:hypothetical protein ARMSODRAFT_1086442 [Armillaria solidipes]|uniref:Uncharacterized protein n=1 Tax=Armillaria solidipes TaxID=1076256 RepID=A0A2H3B857_9AGAR|nr:hypothetical protein ARMSODRAFT_1086442 [Armillaria solidipes]
MKFILPLLFVLYASVTAQAVAIDRDGTNPATPVRDISHNRTNHPTPVAKAKFLASEPEPIKDKDQRL